MEVNNLTKIDLNNYKLYLGPIGLPYPFARPKESIAQGGDYPELKGNDQSPVYTDGLNHGSVLGVEYFMPVAINGYQLPNEPLVSIAGRKTIVETSLAGNTRRGTVKEIINTEDYDVKIRGVIINENANDYPYDLVDQLRKLIEKNEALPIVCALTNLFEIRNIVIKDWDFPEMVGVQNAQAYTLTCRSDEDFLLIQA